MHFTDLTAEQRETFRTTLKKHVHAQFTKVEVFALEIGVSKMTVYRWFQGKAFPKAEQLQRICYTLALAPEELVTGLELPQIPIEFKMVSRFVRSQHQGRGRVVFQMRIAFDSREEAEEHILAIKQALGPEVWNRLPKSNHFKL